MKSNAPESPLVLPAILLIVFIGEGIVMAMLHICGVRGIWDIVLDPLLLTILVAPVLLFALPRLGTGTSSSPKKRLLPRKSSRWGAVAVFGGMGGTTVLVLTGLSASHSVFEAATIETFQTHQLTEARGLAKCVESIFEEVDRDLQFLSRASGFVAATPAAQEEFDRFFETHSDVLNNITLTDAEGSQILRSPTSSTLKNISHWPAFAAVRDTGETHISEPQLCIVDQGVQVVQVTLPIDDQGRFAGVLYASIHLQKLWDKCLPRLDTGHESSCWVIDDDGEILYNSEDRHTGPMWEEIEREWQVGGGTGSQKEEAAEEALRRRVQRGKEGTAAFRNNVAGGVDELVAFAPIRFGNKVYGLAVATRKTDISGPITTNARVTYALMVGMLLFLGVTGYIGLHGAQANARLLTEQRHAAEREQAGEVRERLLRDTEERVKELRCLHKLDASLHDRSTLEDMFQDAASLLPSGWHYPEIARGRVHFDGEDYISEPFEQSRWSQTSDILIDGERRGFVEVCYLEQRPDLDEGPFLKEERNLINSVAHALSEAARRKQAEAALQKIEWMLTGGDGAESVRSSPPQEYVRSHGNLTALNTSRVILDSVGAEILAKISSDYVELLGTSGTIYETNGDYALGIFSSEWCRFLDQTSRNLCRTDDDTEALRSDRWLCHDSCWREASKASIDTGRPVDVECHGGIRLYAVPVRANGEIVGSINVAYGDPPKDPEKIEEVAERYGAGTDHLRQLSDSYQSRPLFIIETAKARLRTSATLIGEIVERKRVEAELKDLQRQLVETSRQAGMSEVATDVLHNVGNVLNSVNVSAGLAFEKIRGSRVPGLVKATALLSEHADDLGTFITQDERGKQLPGYLTKLAEHFADEQNDVLGELTHLTDNIEHIKNIVSAQQSLAGVSGVTEPLWINDLLDNLLEMDVSWLDHLGVKVVREYDELPVVTMDKHKLTQILVNLLKNAKDALTEDRGPDKRLTVRIRRVPRTACLPVRAVKADPTELADKPPVTLDHVQIEVADNAVGIPPENLTKIFAHGFTTKKHGHGFGLHSSALAAKELGGSLVAHSDGPGQGATFTLELPLQPAEIKR